MGATVRSCVELPMRFGMRAKAYTFTWDTEQPEHLAMRLGAPAGDAPLVRLHSECLTGDVFGSQRCDCGPQLQESLFRLHSAGGWLLYLRQEGRGIGLYNKLDAYRLQERGLDTFAANRVMHYPDDLRDYGCAAAMLAALGIARVRLITNNPDKVNQLVAAGIEVVETLSTGLYVTGHNRRYLLAKARQANHALPIEMDEEEAP